MPIAENSLNTRPELTFLPIIVLMRLLMVLEAFSSLHSMIANRKCLAERLIRYHIYVYNYIVANIGFFIF